MNHRHGPTFAAMGQILYVLAVVLLAAAAPAAAEITARAYVDRTSVTLGESVQLRVTVTDAEGGVNTDPITDFKVYPRGTSTSLRMVNGRTTRQATYNFMLIPTRSGSLKIPALEVKADGRTLRTDPIEITVGVQDNTQAPPKDRDVWVSAQVSDQEPYVGQQIRYVFKLIHAVQVSDARFSPPDFQGFEAKEIEERKSYPKVINGREHYVTEVQYVLTPLNPGSRVIEPAMLQLNVLRPGQQRMRDPLDDFFNNPFLNRGRFEPQILQAEALNLKVRPLPPYDGPEPYSGLVGRFTLKAEAEKTAIKVGDSTTVSLTLAGKGNLADAAAPELTPGDAFKVYADTPTEEIQLTPEGYRGKRVFRTALVPVRAGGFEIPPVRLAYFDPEQQAYRTLATDPISLQVAPGESVQAAPIAIAPENLPSLKKKVEFTGRDILPPKEDLDALQPRRPLSPSAFALWLLLPLAAFGAVTLFQRRRQGDAGPAGRMKTRARQALKEADQAGGDSEQMLDKLYQALPAAILAAGGRSGEALTRREAEILLDRAGYDPETIQAACDLLARIEAGKYSGAGLDAEQARDLLQQTHAMVKKLTA
jgi:hypothetical protein